MYSLLKEDLIDQPKMKIHKMCCFAVAVSLAEVKMSVINVATLVSCCPGADFTKGLKLSPVLAKSGT